MDIKFTAMMQTASEKYTSLLDIVYKGKNCGDMDYDKLINLIHSVYMDEVNLIFEMCHDGDKTEKKHIDIPDLVTKR